MMNIIMALIPLGFPAGLWFAFAGALVTIAFFFRRQSHVYVIPALAHWVRIGQPVGAKSIGARLRRLLSLLAQLLIVALLVGALIDPFPQDRNKHRIAIVIDISATMQTHEGDQTRLQLAERQAVGLLASMPPNTQVYLFAAANGLRHTGLGAMSPTDARVKLNALNSTDSGVDLTVGLNAVSFLANDPSAAVYVISDFTGDSPPSVLNSSWNGVAPLHLIPIGSDQADAAITGYWCRPDHRKWQLGTTITSRGMAGQSVMVKALSGGQEVGKANAVLIDGSVQVEMSVDLPPGSSYQIKIDANDAFSVDNQIVGLIPDQQTSICLVTEGNPPLERALRANLQVPIRVIRHVEYDEAIDAAVVIVDGPGLGPLRPGKAHGYLFLDAPDPFGLAILGDEVDPAAVTHWQGDHPILANIDPTLIHFRQIHRLIVGSTATIKSLVWADNVPLINEVIPTGLGADPPKLIYWPFALNGTDLAQHLTFPVMLWNTIEYLSGHNPDPPLRLTGQPLVFNSTTEPTLTSPDQHRVDIRRIGDGFVASEITQQGLYALHTDRGDALVPVNLMSGKGTLPLRRDAAAQAVDAAVVPSATGLLSWLNWRTALVAAGILALMEWLLFHGNLLRIG